MLEIHLYEFSACQVCSLGFGLEGRTGLGLCELKVGFIHKTMVANIDEELFVSLNHLQRCQNGLRLSKIQDKQVLRTGLSRKCSPELCVLMVSLSKMFLFFQILGVFIMLCCQR